MWWLNDPPKIVYRSTELAETSTFREDSTEHIHQWLDENGWEYRTAYAMDKNGKIYEMNLNIAKSRDGRKILYDINNIKEIDHGVVTSKGLAHKNQSHKSSISQNEKNATPDISVEEMLFDEEFYAKYQYEDKTEITDSIESLLNDPPKIVYRSTQPVFLFMLADCNSFNYNFFTNRR